MRYDETIRTEDGEASQRGGATTNRASGGGWSAALACGLVASIALGAPSELGAEPPEDGSSQSETSNDGADEGKREISELSLESLKNPEVETASRKKEPVDEAPAPVTVITSEMIRQINARSLSEVLVTYVPGWTDIEDHNEANVAARGVYASSQQKFLVMLNGHRLNSRAYSMANPDPGIGIEPEKVKQIEVLRGPGSAVYGNVALTGVVNIITKSADEMDGGTAAIGGGSHGQATGSFAYGAPLGDEDDEIGEITTWGKVYRSTGERRRIAPDDTYNAVEPDGATQAILDGYFERPSYDFGFELEVGDFTLLADTRYSKKTSPFTDGGLKGEAFSYNSARPYWGTRAGLSSRRTHLSLSYDTSLGDQVHLSGKVYHDTDDLRVALSIAPESNTGGHIGWRDEDYGQRLTLTLDYDFGIGSGSLMFGEQIDFMRVYDSKFMVFPNGTHGQGEVVSDQSTPLLEKGHEVKYSGFVQLKHRFSEQWLLNLGSRYDFIDRHKDKTLSALSPRAAAIFQPGDQTNLKLSYARSFVDAPYWYRYNSIPSYRGGAELEPEKLTSVQLTPSFSFLDEKLKLRTNFYWNDYTDVTFPDDNAGPDEPIYRSSGRVQMAGAEQEIAYLQQDLRLRANFSYIRALSSKDYFDTDNVEPPFIENISPVTASLVADFRPLWFTYDDLWLNFNGRFRSKQKSPITLGGRRENAPDRFNRPNHEVAPAFILDTGFRLERLFVDGLALRGTVYNVLDTDYRQAGSTPWPYPQPGRWFLANLEYDFGHL